MHFTIPTIALFSASLAAAAPTAGPDGILSHVTDKVSNLKDWKSDWDHKMKSQKYRKSDKVFSFDAEYFVKATPDQVVNSDNEPAPGQEGALGLFKYGINVAENTICYNITLTGVSGGYQSAANTATHIHEAPKGQSGPPRIAFPNPTPVGDEERRTSFGCLTGPFKTGIMADGMDTGDGFHVSQIVANPSGFFTDSHSTLFVPGVVRGQLYC